MTMKKHVINTIEGIRTGEAIQFKNLCLVPLYFNPAAPNTNRGELSDNASAIEYISLKKGLETEQVEITEVDESGSVSEIKVTNNADKPLFIMDGEELAGAKQNRIVNTSMLLAAKSSFVIPVSCTESGRWHRQTHKFLDSGLVMSSAARYGKTARVSANLKSRKGFVAGQSEVWADIETMHSKYATSSGTRSMKDAFSQKDNDLKKYLEALPLQSGQNGMNRLSKR